MGETNSSYRTGCSEAVLDSQFSPLELVAISMALLVAACSMPGTATDPASQARTAALRPVAPDEHAFPPIEAARFRQGAFPSVEALRQIRAGMNKDHVRNLLSHPHFSEDLDARAWNYIFHLRRGQGPAYITCQYMVRFDEEMLTTGAYWNRPECEALAKRPGPRPVVKPLPGPSPAPPVPQKITLGADGMFRNDGARGAELLPEGRRKVELLGGEIRHSFRPPQSISIVGHTDRLVTDELNAALSLAQANAVRDVLVRQGIDPTVIRTTGAGSTQPVMRCSGVQRAPAQADCLQPGRRIEVEVIGDH